MISLKKNLDYKLAKIAFILSGLSVLTGVLALITEKIVFPYTLENYKNLYAPLPYPEMIYSLIEFVLIIICFCNLKRTSGKTEVICVVLIAASFIGMNCFYRFSNDSAYGTYDINYEYRVLYSIFYSVVSTSERYLNLFSLLLLAMLSGIMIQKNR